MEVRDCVSEADLRAFLLGELPEHDCRTLTDHLEHCAGCEQAACRLDDLTDAALRSLRQALRAHPAADDRAAPGGPHDPPCRVPGYEVLEELGRGGMSVVYKARQAHPARLVALKVILAGRHADPERRARFLAEANAIARLRHPNIVQIYEAGEHDGLPFLSLEFVDGGSLAAKFGGRPQPPRCAAALVETLARALHHSHEHGVVHRDLKPANILLDDSASQPGDLGTPKVTDFGLAKQERSELTATGALLGTPSYMAPEQAAGDNHAVGPAADLYALGVILYELLTGRPPIQGLTPLETLAQARTQEPVPPSRLQTATPRDLDTICLKCLAKEPHRRYATALELADDLRRFLDGKPILARPVGHAERLWRWSRRNPAWAAMLLTVAVLLLVILVGGSVGYLRLHRALDQSENDRRAADHNFAEARKAERATQEQLFDSLLAQARGSSLSRRPGQRFGSLKVLAEATRLARRLELPPERFLDLRNAAILALAAPDLYPAHAWDGFPQGSVEVDFDQDLEVYVRTDEPGFWEVRRVADDRLLCRRPRSPAPKPGYMRCRPHLSQDGRFLAALNRAGPGSRLEVWGLPGVPGAEREPVLLFEEPDVACVAYRPGGAQLVLAHFDGSLSLRDLEAARESGRAPASRRLPQRGTPDQTMTLAVHPTEPLAAVGCESAHVVEVRDLRDGAVVHPLRMSTKVSHVAWHPLGHTLAVSEESGVDIHFFDRSSFREVRTLRAGGRGTVLAFNRTGDRLAAYGWDQELQLFDLGTDRLLFQTSAWMPTGSLRFSRDGRRLACVADVVAGRLGVWDVGDADAYRTLLYRGGKDRSVYPWADVGPDNRLLAVQVSEGIHFWDLATGQELGDLLHGAHEFPLFVPGTPPALLTGGCPGVIRWPLVAQADLAGSLRLGPPTSLTPVTALPTSHSRDGRITTAASQAARAGADCGGWLFRPEGCGAPVCLLKGQDVMNVAVSPDGHWIVTLLCWPRNLTVWDATDPRLGTEDARPVKVLEAEEDSFHPRFSPDGRWLTLSGIRGGLYAVGTWERGLRFSGRGQFSPDSRLLAVEAGKGVIRLIDVATGRDVARLEDPNQDTALYFLFSPDGTRLVTLGKGREGGIHVWALRVLRGRLKELGLDWEAPDYPAAPETPTTPLRLEIVP